MFEPQKKVVLVGPSNSGKTQAVHTLVDLQEAVLKTIGCTHHSLVIDSVSGATCRLNLWDCAGSRHYEALLPTSLKNADAVVLFYDPQVFNDVERWLKMLDPLILESESKLYMVRSIRRDWQSKPSSTVLELAHMRHVRHMDIDSCDKVALMRLMREIVEDLMAQDRQEESRREADYLKKKAWSEESAGLMKGLGVGLLVGIGLTFLAILISKKR